MLVHLQMGETVEALSYHQRRWKVYTKCVTHVYIITFMGF